MRQTDKWQPTKFEFEKGTLRGSRDVTHLSVGSRLSADRIAGCYDSYIKAFCRGALVDLGCGNVPLYEVYRHYAESITCADWPNSPHASKHLDVICDLNRTLPFAPESFDTVILSDVLEHIARPDLLWDELYRIVREGGHILLNVPFIYVIHEEPHDYYRYTEWALRRFAKIANFQVVVLEATGGSPEVITDIVAKHLIHVPFVGRLIAAGMQNLVAWATRTASGHRISLATARALPYGYFMVARKSG